MELARYNYKARDITGRMVDGVVALENRDELDAFFLKKDLIPVKVVEKKLSKARSFSFSKKPSEEELIAFTRQFAAAYSAGVPVVDALKNLAGQAVHPAFQLALKDMIKKIQGGAGLTEVFHEHPHIFDSTYLSIVKAGEASGNLDISMDYAAGLLEKQLMHKERIKAAFLYPKIVLGVMGIAIVVIITFVIPQFAKLYGNFGADLPLPTRVLISISNWTQKGWWLGIFLVPLAYRVVSRLKKNSKLMLYLHEKFLKLPIFGNLILKTEMGYFCTTYALLFRAGINVLEATDMAIKGIKNTFIRSQLNVIIPTIKEGGSIGEALGKVSLVPPMMTSVVTIGEETGTLDKLLDRVALLYENETDLILKKLPTLLEPVILAMLFGMVLFLSLAVYLPLWKMSSLVRAR